MPLQCRFPPWHIGVQLPGIGGIVSACSDNNICAGDISCHVKSNAASRGVNFMPWTLGQTDAKQKRSQLKDMDCEKITVVIQGTEANNYVVYGNPGLSLTNMLGLIQCYFTSVSDYAILRIA